MALLDGKVALVTGASSGIGRACAIEIAKQDAVGLVLNHLGDPKTTEDAESLKSDLEARHSARARVILAPGDISKPETSTKLVKAAVEAFGRIDILVSNAGICQFADFLTLPHELWERTRAVNLDGAFYIVQAVANQMKSQSPQGGSIIQISSISALVGGGGQTHYTPTKAGSLSLMRSCAIALGPFNIRCNAILPGTIETEMNRDDLADPDKRRYMEGRSVLGRLGKPEDVAGPVVFLASDLAGFVSGAELLVDGGMFVNFQ